MTADPVAKPDRGVSVRDSRDTARGSLPRSGLRMSMPPDVKPPPRSIYRSPFAIADTVAIDGSELTGRVTGFMWRHDDGPSVSVAWLHNGEAQTAWFEEWRLERAP